MSLRVVFMSFSILAAVGCAELPEELAEPAPTSNVESLDNPIAPAPPPMARTAEQFDTTSATDRAQAVQAASGGAKLGTVTATLGSPTDPGIWVKTPLVDAVTVGKVDYNGTTINVELRPADGASQISLPAMRLLNAPLAGLITIDVFNG
ncbi:hypothetical protein BVC71_12360 [Marivivens niveibacter]|uniref:D-galactarate dehydratase n=1 Tax=Marivivens niveibacter TaxID=1930667 RepID=A0A251WX41_9RHOB|nr:D-galactarate dehydratase [Marivivens niveibacter]OUD08715.1 hypothetical protein BVC71_12360 [Marivivens niveibacter]